MVLHLLIWDSKYFIIINFSFSPFIYHSIKPLQSQPYLMVNRGPVLFINYVKLHALTSVIIDKNYEAVSMLSVIFITFSDSFNKLFCT